MTQNITQGDWIPVTDGTVSFALITLKDIDGSPVKQQESIACGFKNVNDAVLCSYAPEMLDCLKSCAVFLSKMDDADKPAKNLCRYVNSLVCQAEPCDIEGGIPL